MSCHLNGSFMGHSVHNLHNVKSSYQQVLRRWRLPLLDILQNPWTWVTYMVAARVPLFYSEICEFGGLLAESWKLARLASGNTRCLFTFSEFVLPHARAEFSIHSFKVIGIYAKFTCKLEDYSIYKGIIIHRALQKCAKVDFADIFFKGFFGKNPR